jgi:hypothetical protein
MKLPVLAAALLLFAPAYAQASEGATANDTARVLAGMQPSADSPLLPLTREGAWRQHASHFNSEFENVEARQLSKIRAWSAANLKAERPVLFYMFSGPDFLYANAFFPHVSTYVLSGLEPVGQIPDLTKLPRGSLWQGLGNIRTSLQSILAVSFFQTLAMRNDLSNGPMAGTLPILYVFLARSNKVIHEVTLVNLNEQGEVREGDGSAARSAAPGVKIVFSDAEGRRQTLYYFSTNLANDGFKRSGFLKFCEQLGEGDGFVKSASYLLHGDDFSLVRNFLLARSASILQDDTGIPVAYFDEGKWQLQPYGHYYGPISLFQNRYQPRLNQLYQRGHSRSIDFGIGYRWRPQESNLLQAVKIVTGMSSEASLQDLRLKTEEATPKAEAEQKAEGGRNVEVRRKESSGRKESLRSKKRRQQIVERPWWENWWGVGFEPVIR